MVECRGIIWVPEEEAILNFISMPLYTVHRAVVHGLLDEGR